MKAVIFVVAVLCAACAFQIEESREVGDVNWPYTRCNADVINITGLTLAETPAKNSKNTAKIAGKALSRLAGN